jgi:hypothetical protein
MLNRIGYGLAVAIGNKENIFCAFSKSADFGSDQAYFEGKQGICHLQQKPRPVLGCDFHNGGIRVF